MDNLLRPTCCISLKLAMQLLQAALTEAGIQQVNVSIVLVGPEGEMIHMAHMDNAPFLSRDIARNKALTAASFKTSTCTWQARLQTSSEAVRQGLPLQANLALFGGGEPLFYNGLLIGAIGVSGSSEQVDERCAKAAVICLEHVLHTASLAQG